MTINQLVEHKEFITTTVLALIERQEVQEHLQSIPPMEPRFDPFVPKPDTDNDVIKRSVSTTSLKSNLTLPLRMNRATRLRLAAGQHKQSIGPKLALKRIKQSTSLI